MTTIVVLGPNELRALCIKVLRKREKINPVPKQADSIPYRDIKRQCYLSHCISSFPDWVRRVYLFLDNTCSTNKNFYTMTWALEMVQQQKIDFIRISFLVAGHTKFSRDLLFSKIAKTYNQRDVFTTEELHDVIAQYADVVVDDGTLFVTGGVF